MSNQIFYSRLINIFTLSLFMAVTPAAIADYSPGPNQKRATDKSSRSTSPRGGKECLEDRVALTVLAPQTYIGQTTSSHPTFAWFVSNSNEIEFKLFEFDSKEKLKQISTQIQKRQTSSGINKLSLPENQPGLVVGKKYIWQLTINCGLENLTQRREFMIIQMPAELSSNLSTAKDNVEKAKLYAKAGYWYDALAEALKFPNDQKSRKEVSILLQDLAQSEKPDQE